MSFLSSGTNLSIHPRWFFGMSLKSSIDRSGGGSTCDTGCLAAFQPLALTCPRALVDTGNADIVAACQTAAMVAGMGLSQGGAPGCESGETMVPEVRAMHVACPADATTCSPECLNALQAVVVRCAPRPQISISASVFCVSV